MAERAHYKKIGTAACHWCDWGMYCKNKSKKCLKKSSRTRARVKKVFDMYNKN